MDVVPKEKAIPVSNLIIVASAKCHTRPIDIIRKTIEVFMIAKPHRTLVKAPRKEEEYSWFQRD